MEHASAIRELALVFQLHGRRLRQGCRLHGRRRGSPCRGVARSHRRMIDVVVVVALDACVTDERGALAAGVHLCGGGGSVLKHGRRLGRRSSPRGAFADTLNDHHQGKRGSLSLAHCGLDGGSVGAFDGLTRPLGGRLRHRHRRTRRRGRNGRMGKEVRREARACSRGARWRLRRRGCPHRDRVLSPEGHLACTRLAVDRGQRGWRSGRPGRSRARHRLMDAGAPCDDLLRLALWQARVGRKIHERR